MLQSNYLDNEFEESDQILNNEISIWLTSLESMYPSILRRIAFIKPDYDEVMLNSLEYKFDKGQATYDTIGDLLKPSFDIERSFLEGVVMVLTQLLNHKGSLSSVGFDYVEIVSKSLADTDQNSEKIESKNDNKSPERPQNTPNIVEHKTTKEATPSTSKPNLKSFQAQTSSEPVAGTPVESNLCEYNPELNNNLMINKNKDEGVSTSKNDYTDETLIFNLPAKTEVTNQLTDVEEEEDEGSVDVEEPRFTDSNSNLSLNQGKCICKQINKYQNPCADEIANIIK